MISRFNSGVLQISLVLALGRVAFASPHEPGARTITIPDGTPIHLYLMDDLDSKKAKNGDTIRFKARVAVQVSDLEVIAVDAPITGHVGAVGRSSFAGHSGKLGLLIDYAIAIDGSKIPLRGEATLKGGSNGAVTAAATVYYGPAALLIRGWDAEIHRGTMLNAYVNGDQIINFERSNEFNGTVQNTAPEKTGTLGAPADGHPSPVPQNISVSGETARAATANISIRLPVVQGTIGVSCEGNLRVRRNGITVSDVVIGGPADQAGIKSGDVILAIDDHYMYTIEELNNVIVRFKPGVGIRIRYRRYAATYEMPLIVGSREVNGSQR